MLKKVFRLSNRYRTNTGRDSISSYAIARDGSITPLDAQTGLTGDGSTPTDMASSNNSKFLYAIGSESSAIHSFEVQADGSLEPLGEVSVPGGSLSLAAR